MEGLNLSLTHRVPDVQKSRYAELRITGFLTVGSPACRGADQTGVLLINKTFA